MVSCDMASGSQARDPDDPRAPTRAVLRLIAGAITISFSAVFVRLVEVPPTTSAFYRMLIGGVVILGWVIARRVPLRLGRTASLALLAAGCAFAADLGLWHRSIWYVGPGLATLLANFQVFALALAGVLLFGERLRPQLVISIVLAVAGLMLIVGPGWDVLDASYRWGVIFGLLTAVAYSAYILCLRWAQGAASTPAPARDLGLASLASAACLGVVALIEGTSLAIPSAGAAGVIAAYALVAQILGWLLISSALGQVPASRVGLILLLQPSLAFVWDVLFFDRPFTAREGAGAGLALAAIYFGARLGSRQRSARASAAPAGPERST